MVTQLQAALSQGVIDVSGSPGQRPQPGFRTIVKPSRTASQADIRRAIQTGVFPFRFFSVQPTRVRSIGVFKPGVPTGIGGRPLTKASIRGLEKAGIIRPRFETRAGIAVKKVETPTQKSTRLAQERRIERAFGLIIPSVGKVRAQDLERSRQFFRQTGGPLATGVKLSDLRIRFLEGFNILFQPRVFRSSTLNIISRKLDIEANKLDKRITAGTATQAQINKFNVLVTQFNIQASRTQAKQLRETFKERPSPLKPVKPILSRLPSDSVTAADVFPKGVNIGSVVGRGVNIGEAQKRVADFLEDIATRGPKGKRRIPTGIERSRIGTLRAIGSAIGTVFAGFETVGTAIALGGQEVAKGRTSVIARKFLGPGGKQVKFVFSGGVAQFIRANQNRDLLVITNPLKAIKVTGNTAVITPTAIGRAGEAVFDIAIITGLGRAHKVVALSKAKKPIGIIGSIGKVKKGFTVNILKKLKLRNIKALAKGVTKPVKISKETKLLKEIAKIQRNLRARKLRVTRPTKLKKLQSQVLDLREKFKAIDFLKPVPKSIRAAQKEIAALTKLGKKFKPARVKITPTGIVRKPVKLGARARARIRRTSLELRLTDLRTRIKPSTVFKPVPRTEKGLRLAIKKILAVEKSRLARTRLPIRLKSLQDKVLRLRERIKPSTFLKPVPKNVRSALKEIKELEDLEKVAGRLVRSKIRVKNLQEQVLLLREEFRPASILKPIPKTEKALLKEISGLNRIRAGRLLRGRTKFRVKGLEEQLRLLKEKALITKRRKLTVGQQARVNQINSRLRQFREQLKVAKAKKVKPKKITKPVGRQVQIQKVKKKVVKKKRKVRLTQRQVSRFVSLPRTAVVVTEFARIFAAPRSTFFGLTSSGVSQLTRGVPITATLISFSPREVLSIRQRLSPQQRTKLGLKAIAVTKPVVTTAAAVKAASALRARQRARIRAKVRARVVTKAKAKVKRKVELKKPKKRLPPPTLIPGQRPVSVETIARSKGPFNVVVRIRGKRKIVNKFPLTGNQALALGGKFADNNAARSFTIVKTTGKTRKLKVARFNKKKFRKPKGNTKLQKFFLVEKTKFAIDTRGEKRQITAKGIRAPKRKKKRKVRKRGKKK